MSHDPYDQAREALGDGPGASRRLRQRGRFLAETGERSPRRLWALAALPLAVALWFAVRPSTRPAAQLAGGGPAVLANAVLEGSKIEFNDGSEVTLAHDARAQVLALDQTQVVLRVESGRIDASVHKGTGRVWRYLAGPFQVRVVGTKLAITWSASRGAIEVGVSEGRVEVTGPGLETPLAVSAGESVVRKITFETAPVLEREAVDAGVAPSPSPLHHAAAPSKEATADWRQLLRSGKRTAALTAAQTQGLLADPAMLSSEEVLLLADAARLEHQAEVAARLLSQVIARGGEEGAEAAFLLGRAEFEAQPDQAIALWRTSLSLSPDGRFSEQARSRALEAAAARAEPASAKRAAVDYLAHYPEGALADFARQVLAQ